MLEWKRVDDSWFGNGFQVRQVAPTLWSLDYSTPPGPIDVEGPIAELQSLQACKYKAEKLHEKEAMSHLRSRLVAVGLAGWAVALIAGNPFGFIVGGVVGSAALLELASTWYEGRVGGIQNYLQ
ncbi:MAG: hypothetical protein PVF87_01385 [Acidimicrobiia bacterium]